MKKISFIAAAVIMFAALCGSAFGANSLGSGSKALSIGFGDSSLTRYATPNQEVPNNPIVDIGGRFFTSPDLAITAGLGLQMTSGDLDGSYLSFNVGIRKYLKTDDFAPFIGGRFAYLSYDASLGSSKFIDFTAWEFDGLVGAEYFLAKQFSIEGSVGLGIGHLSDNLNNRDSNFFGTRNYGVSANF